MEEKEDARIVTCYNRKLTVGFSTAALVHQAVYGCRSDAGRARILYSQIRLVSQYK